MNQTAKQIEPEKSTTFKNWIYQRSREMVTSLTGIVWLCLMTNVGILLGIGGMGGNITLAGFGKNIQGFTMSLFVWQTWALLVLGLLTCLGLQLAISKNQNHQTEAGTLNGGQLEISKNQLRTGMKWASRSLLTLIGGVVGLYIGSMSQIGQTGVQQTTKLLNEYGVYTSLVNNYQAPAAKQAIVPSAPRRWRSLKPRGPSHIAGLTTTPSTECCS